MEPPLQDAYAHKARLLFPKDMTLQEARAAIKDAPGFRETKKGDVILFNYDFAFKGSFPDPALEKDPYTAYLLKVRRECRGLIFSSGKVISRRFHKFFNIGELPETEDDKIDLKNRQWHILEKMDGSLVAPLLTDGKIKLGSKMGVTEMSNKMEDDFLADSKVDYATFCEEWMSRDCTPMFEFCSRRAPIVIEYPKDSLVLTAIRNNSTGEYVPYEDMISAAKTTGIPMVTTKNVKPASATELLNRTLFQVKLETGIEGYVLRFSNGEMFKLKCEWYVHKHKNNRSYNLAEKDAWALILDGQLDDTSVYLPPEKKERMQAFSADLFRNITATAAKIKAATDDAQARKLDKRAFVAEMQQKKAQLPYDISLYFMIFDGKDPVKTVIKTLRDACSSASTLAKVRSLAGGIEWKD